MADSNEEITKTDTGEHNENVPLESATHANPTSEDTLSKKEDSQLRHDLVNTAMKFLQSPSVAQRPYSDKRAFLMKKGLTEQEIEQAFSAAASHSFAPVQVQPHQGLAAPHYPQYGIHPGTLAIPAAAPSMWWHIRAVFNFIFLITGVAYGLHYLYKWYIGPFLTGHRQKSLEEEIAEVRMSITTSLERLQTSVDSLQQSLLSHTLTLQSSLEKDKPTSGVDVRDKTTHQLNDLKGELASVKSLLLSRNTFPPTPALSLSIPSWQKAEKPTASPHNSDGPTENATNGICSDDSSDENVAVQARVEETGMQFSETEGQQQDCALGSDPRGCSAVPSE